MIWHVGIAGTFTATHSGLCGIGDSVHGTARLFADGTIAADNTANQTFGEGFLHVGTVEKAGSLVVVAGQTYSELTQWADTHTSELICNSPLGFHPGRTRLSGCATPYTDAAMESAVEHARRCERVTVLTGLVGNWVDEGADRAALELPPRAASS